MKVKFLNKTAVRRKKYLVLLVLLLVLLLIGGSVLVYNAAHAPISSQEHERVMQQAQTLAYQLKYTEIETVLSKHLQEKLTDDMRYDTLTRLVVNYQNQKQNDKALETFQTANTIKPNQLSFDMAIVVVSIATQQNNSQLALEYYKKALEIARHDTDIGNDMYMPNLQKIITKLENGEPITTPPTVDTSKLPANHPAALPGQ